MTPSKRTQAQLIGNVNHTFPLFSLLRGAHERRICAQHCETIPSDVANWWRIKRTFMQWMYFSTCHVWLLETSVLDVLSDSTSTFGSIPMLSSASWTILVSDVTRHLNLHTVSWQQSYQLLFIPWRDQRATETTRWWKTRKRTLHNSKSTRKVASNHRCQQAYKLHQALSCLYVYYIDASSHTHTSA